MFKPTATYRIQFHKGFTFKNLVQILPYLEELGVKTIYASPIFAAAPGSTHGYDVVDPNQINPEIGTEAELIALSKVLKQKGISWLQDIVPNHMAFHSHNAWLMDVLEKWDQSPYFNFFDLNFPTQSTDKRLMVPFLGEDLTEAIDQQKLQLGIKNEKCCFLYGESFWPLNQNSLQLIGNDLGAEKIRAKLPAINQNPQLIHDLADAQYYRLCQWQETDSQLNYRRFFTVNGLICLNIQHEVAFETYHQYIFDLVRRGIFQGLRVDHIDGLADPQGYLERLRSEVGSSTYIVVEKILASDEQLPQNWPVEGTTGYDFLYIVNNLLTNRDAEKKFNQLYREITQKKIKAKEQVILKKRAILDQHMQGELDHLVTLFGSLHLVDKKDLKSLPKDALKLALADFLVHFPVYRSYPEQFPLQDGDRKIVKAIFEKLASGPATDLLADVFLSNRHTENDALLTFFRRCMQFSGPLMAKGVEDTLMYTYNRFIGHAEVGDAPDAFGLSVASFHQKMELRLANWPHTMNATATHDTKRGEDVRARLNVLSDIPEDWEKLVMKLQKNPVKVKGELHQNDKYLIFQSLLGVMPFENMKAEEMSERLHLYLEKALREAKKRSDWATPNEDYEDSAKRFMLSLLDKEHPAYAQITSFLDQIADCSIINSLVQLLLKFTCPGIPDVYQGTELWDLSLVDPDNRRPVDYKLRNSLIKALKGQPDIDTLRGNRRNGQVKLWLTKFLFDLRSTNQLLFDEGAYIPLEIEGTFKKHILAFLRKHGQEILLVAVPLGMVKLAKQFKSQPFDWKDTTIILPQEIPTAWKNRLTHAVGQKDVLDQGLKVNDIFDQLPLAILNLEHPADKRSSGILMPIASLPSGFGIGDLGPNAREFVDFLARSKQDHWQLLPLNPTSALESYSPYSAYSTMAGNPVLISLDHLADQGFLDPEELKSHRFGDDDTINYKLATEIKEECLHLAFLRFEEKSEIEITAKFESFCESEDTWLHDFALFTCLRKHHQFMPWSEWPEDYKFRQQKALDGFGSDFAREIREIKWQQFIFSLQWKRLKAYAKSKNIKLIGDLPFYAAYDSADVWANPQYFKLDQQLNRKVVAGVPPDAFNADGQIWGMPIYNWQVLAAEGYAWWIKRLQKNLDNFDLLRLDHFRAFHSFWEIKVDEETAKNGIWIDGPGLAFFKEVHSQLAQMPFIAEDLGGNMEGPIKLREKIKLPGMKVLQFGFGADLPNSPHLPHNYEHQNYVVYTGTHDNNTTKGWFSSELDEKGKKRLKLYVGKKVNEKEVNRALIQLALSSIAELVIFPMQDLLGLDERARMNRPATTIDNWRWRLRKTDMTVEVSSWLARQTEMFNRA